MSNLWGGKIHPTKFGLQVPMKEKAFSLEEKAKELRKEGNFLEAAKFHLGASKLFGKMKYLKNQKWNLANYFCCKADYYCSNQEFEIARKNFLYAEKFFLSMGLKESAFYVASKAISMESKQIKDKVESLNRFIELMEILLEKYKDISNTKTYINNKIFYYYLKFKLYKKQGNYELAKFWIEKSYKESFKAFQIFKLEYFLKNAIFREHHYWNLNAKIQEARKDFLKAAEFYKKSAEVIEKFDKDRAIDENINYFKCLAIAHKYNKNLVEEYLDKAIHLAQERRDTLQENYLLALKFDHLSKFSSSLEERIELLKLSKEYYFRANEKKTAKAIEFLLNYLLSKKFLKDGDYRNSLKCLQRAISLVKYASFPNVVSSSEVLKYEECFHKAYVHFSEGKFSKSAEEFKQWLSYRKDLLNTKRYEIYKNLTLCCEILGKSKLTHKELYEIEEALHYIRKNKLSLRLYYAASLVYAYISLVLNGLKSDEVMEKIKIGIIEKITSESIFDLESRLKIQMTMEKKEWLLRLPPIFAEKFDHCLYLLNNILEDVKYMAFREFYLLLENYLKVLVEFNAKLLWGITWQSEIEKLVANGMKPFSKFTFGDFVDSVIKLKQENSRLLSNVSEDVFELMKKQVPLRNKLSHDISIDINELSNLKIDEDVSKIMRKLFPAFPLCFEIVGNNRAPWYDAKIIWNLIPKRISVYYENKEGDLLKKGIYYTAPEIFMENKISLKDVFKAEFFSGIM
jgi:tetratricopeptide (TPR) repeat protein